MPTTLKYTPEGSNLLWGRTEYSVNFDTFSSALIDGKRVTHSSDHLAVAATTLLADREHWNVAIAPVVTFGFRDQPGFRAGLTAITATIAAAIQAVRRSRGRAPLIQQT